MEEINQKKVEEKNQKEQIIRDLDLKINVANSTVARSYLEK